MKEGFACDSTKLLDSAATLSKLIADLERHYINSEFHSNITGNNLTELLEKSEVLDSCLKQALINHNTGIHKANTEMQEISTCLHHLLEREKTLLDFAGESADEGTIAAITAYMKRQEELMSAYATGIA